MADLFHLTRSQAGALARALRFTADWQDLPGGDVSVTLLHDRTNTEITITVWSARKIEPKVIRGFRMESRDG